MANQSRIKEIIIHYTATFADDTSVTVDVIDGWHKARGWAGIGYHFVIYQDGTLHIGRPMHVVGAHAPPNTGRLGICYVGGLERATGANVGLDTRTAAQIGTMVRLIKDLLAGKLNTDKVKVDPDAKVLGHRDVGSTQCPGFDVKPWWQSILAGRPMPTPAPAPRPPDAEAPPVKTPDVHEDPPKVGPAAGAATTAVVAVGGAAAAWGWIGAAAVLAVAVGLAVVFRKQIATFFRERF